MKVELFVGVGSPTITIERPTDLFPWLDQFHSVMIEMAEAGNPEANRCAKFINKLMVLAEREGFGSFDDIDSIEY